jgi:hypothetical protein
MAASGRGWSWPRGGRTPTTASTSTPATPSFIQGIATMTNGENTAFVPIKEWLLGKNIPGYIGYHSDSETFTHILHYVTKKLKLPLELYKHVITPLKTRNWMASQR